MNHIQLKKATTDDLLTVQRLGRETFLESFADSTTEADMSKYLEDNFSEHKLKTELSNPGSMFFVAWENNNPVGYLKINFGDAQTEQLGDFALEIERIYVKSSHQGKKVGQALYEQAIKVAGHQNHSYIWLGVWEKNARAIRFYEKQGFVAFDKHVFKIGDDEQIDIMMKKVL
jgi:ribosomal protein S18 acetylase RimI-like enzyme